MPAIRRLRKLSSDGTSAMYQRLSELQQNDALITLRTYNMQAYFANSFYRLLDDRLTFWRYNKLCKIMMDFQLHAVGVLFLTGIAVGAAVTRADAGTTGVALLFAKRFSSIVSRILTRLVTVENDMVAVERLEELANLPVELSDGADVPEDWPCQGALQVDGLTAGYDKEDILKDISFSVKAGERVGIVGRTGAGKSSLVLALTRHLNMTGRILIDGIDLSTLKVRELRKQLFIISQDPYILGGTLRNAIDRAGAYSDDEIQSVLSKIGFSTGTADLEFSVTRGGLNLSHGQRQMVRLAQALLSRRKMVIMDEATSSIDADADAGIQAALRDTLKESTLIVVAHRLATVADFDKVLVLEDGRLVEGGPPAELYRKKAAFCRLVNASADKEALVQMLGG